MGDSPAKVVETHTGIVFFVGDRVYKLKKPVDLGFVDFSSREARHQACLAEVRLNRRFSPEVYLGVADVHGVDGAVCDHLVVMRRMPAERRLAALVRAGLDVDDAVRAVARSLAAWHAVAPRGPEVAAEGTRDALLRRWDDSFKQVRALRDGPLHDDEATAIEESVHRFLGGREALFAARIADGRVVDGHGDLLADDVFCLDDGPRILDCLEFDDRLRYLDGLDDAAFLAMDLEHLGAPVPAGRFLDWYAEFAGDPAPGALRHHYVAYRAFVRAKVSAMRAGQGDAGAASKAQQLARLTLRHLRAGAIGLILVGGLPGTGKSTLAGALADRLQWTLISSDRVRKEEAGIPVESSASAPFGTGLYEASRVEDTYRELVDRARRLLGRGESVILDASWTSSDQRALAAEAALETHSELHELRCDTPPEVARERLDSRPQGMSDADRAIALEMAAHADPWPKATVVDTSGSVDDALEQALTAVRPHEADTV